MSTSLPLVLLAGRDRKGAPLPEAGRDQHPLHGYKAVELEIAGRPLIERLLETLRDSGAFGPIFVAGPARVYAALRGVELIDTDRDFGDNIRAAIEGVRRRGLVGQVAFMTSDVLPDPGELRAALDDLERHQPCDFWTVECRVRDAGALGASGWKPKYLIRPEGEAEPVATLPGHLLVADPRIARLDVLYRAFELAYRTRNRPTRYRRRVVVSGLLGALLAADLKRLVTLRRPGVTFDMLWNGLALVRKLVTTGCGQREMEDRLRRIWVHADHRRRHPERRGRVMVHDGLTLGRDVDTEEEARELSRQFEESRAAST
jgi:hypothetical protein